MKKFLLVTFLLFFVIEVLVDTSTAFVRTSPQACQTLTYNDGTSGTSEPTHSKHTPTKSRTNMDSSSHVALPSLPKAPRIKVFIFEEVLVSKLNIPRLNPPKSRIERPPIS